MEEEIQKRKSAEHEFEKIRADIYSQSANFSQEKDMMRRTIDDLKYSNEEHIKTIHLKDEEVRFLHKEIQTWKEVIDKSGDEVTALKEIIADLEDKNRKLNEKLNEIIYNKASAYK